jgi:2-haloacid dehalogenase
MGISITRRNLVLAASSLGPALLTGRLDTLAKFKTENSHAPAMEKTESTEQVAGAISRPKVLVFDVNQTLLDLNALRPHFERLFGDARVLDEWFALLLQYSLVVTVTDSYSDFGSVGRAVLQMLAKTKGVKLSTEDESRILQGLLFLPPHPEVPANLKRLRAAGYRMVTLTNSSPAAVKSQLQNSGLAPFFDESISVESARRFKPDLQVYRGAAAHLGEPAADLLLIAAHAWDVYGAMKAGWQAAFISRGGITPFPLGPAPGISGPDLTAVADALLK